MTQVLPENILKCMSPADRKAIGQMTASEASAKSEAKSERDLQQQIISLLRLKGIEPNVSRMDKRKTDRVGWPDVVFCVSQRPVSEMGDSQVGRSFACAWEIKHGTGALSKEQTQMAIRLQSPPNCWRYRVIRSANEALLELRQMGL